LLTNKLPKLLLRPLLMPPLPLLLLVTSFFSVTDHLALTDSHSEVDSEVDSEDSEEMPTHGLRSVTSLNTPPLTLLMTPTSTLSPNT
jgi:hypothetical protein